MSQLLEYITTYISNEITIIPLEYGQKVPKKGLNLKEILESEFDAVKILGWLREHRSFNIGVVLGKPSKCLIVVDVDDEEKLPEVREKLGDRNFLGDTWIVKTGKGLHYYFRLEDGCLDYERRKLGPGVDILGKGYVVAPPSLHPNGSHYEFLVDPSRTNIRVITREDLELLEQAVGLISKQGGNGNSVRLGKVLYDSQIDEIVEVLKPFYKQGFRHRIVVGLIGMLMKAGISEEYTRKVIERLAEDDEEKQSRLYQVEWHYKYKSSNVDELAGSSMLREALQGVALSEGMNDELVTPDDIALSVIAEIESILAKPGVRSIVIKSVDNVPVEFVTAGRTRISHVRIKRKSDDEEHVVRELLCATSIATARRGVVYPTGDYTYEVKLTTGEVVKGELSSILSYLAEHYGLTSLNRRHVSMLIQHISHQNDERTLYYATGYWVTDDGGLVRVHGEMVASEDRILPWRLPEAVSKASYSDKEKSAGALYGFINSYRNPSKALTVLGFAMVATLAHYIKPRVGIFPHMVIIGENESGKTALLDMIKTLLGMDFIEAKPLTEYQADKILSKTTLPLLLNELGEIFESKGGGPAVDVLNEATTILELRTRYGKTFGGRYLALRSVIATTNRMHQIPIFMKDKYIFIVLHRDEGIDPELASGFTPLTMPDDVKEALPALGDEIVQCVYDKVISGALDGATRSDIYDRILSTGAGCIAGVLGRYGYRLEYDVAKGEDLYYEDVELYNDLFKSMLKQLLVAPVQGVTLKLITEASVPEKATDDEHAGFKDRVMRHVEEGMAVAVKSEDTGRIHVFMKKTFITTVKNLVARGYGVQMPNTIILIRVLGLKVRKWRNPSTGKYTKIYEYVI